MSSHGITDVAHTGCCCTQRHCCCCQAILDGTHCTRRSQILLQPHHKAISVGKACRAESSGMLLYCHAFVMLQCSHSFCVFHTRTQFTHTHANPKTQEAAAAAAKTAAAAAPAPTGVTDWTEHTAPDGRKYYYSKTLKKSVWTMPEEMKRARQGGGVGTTATPMGATPTAPPTAVAAKGSASAVGGAPVGAVGGAPVGGGPAGVPPAAAAGGAVRPPAGVGGVGGVGGAVRPPAAAVGMGGMGGVGGFGRPPMGVMGYGMPGMPPVQDTTPLVYSSKVRACVLVD